MPIRLVKACKELNIGISTAVEFLAKSGYEIESNPNYRLADDLYLMLAKEFNKDMALKLESDRLTQERQTKEKEKEVTVAIEGFGEEKLEEKPKKKPKKTHISVEDTLGELPSLKTVGKIDLDTDKLKSEEEVELEEKPEVVEVKEEKKVQAKKTEPVVSKSTPKIESKPEETVEVIAEEPAKEKPKPKKEKKEEAVVVEEKSQTEQVEAVELETKKEDKKKASKSSKDKKKEVKKEVKPKEEEEVEKKDGIFAVEIEELEGFTIKGKLDLDKIDTTTRPRPLSREEKKKERERKAKLAAEKRKKLAAEEGEKRGRGKRKKRERISNQRVDIDRFPSDAQSKRASKTARPRRRPVRTVVDEAEVERQIKETLARMAAGGRNRGKGARYRREKRESISARQTEMEKQERAQETVLQLTEFVTVNELAVMMDVNVNEVIATCMSIGVMVSINQRLDAETINIVAEEFGFTTEFVSADLVEAIEDEEPDKEEDLEFRAPIVTVMGHVDHGKTSLLDYIRKTNVIAGEAGGITQHIGAYNVKLENDQRITFLDTPGHEAFTAMRARGAKVTDIAIIIVAADDSVMPQTVEAINHASAAGVPIVFAINKVDKPTANPDKIKEALANMNYLVEEWGGKYQSQDVSAKTGDGMKELLEKVLLEAEMLELKANPKRRAVGSIVESSLDKGRGYVATVLVESGTLRMGDVVLAGTYFGRIKLCLMREINELKKRDHLNQY